MADDNVVPLRTVHPDKCQPGDPNTITTPEGDVLNVGTAEITADGLGFKDMEAAINMRKWLQDACEAKGAKVLGSGYGFGRGDLDLEIEGFLYNVSIGTVGNLS